MHNTNTDFTGLLPDEKLTNIFHCTIHKAGSQWIKGIFTDKLIQTETGLVPYEYVRELPGGYDKRKIHERFFEKPFPAGRVMTPLYIGYENYITLPKPGKFKAIYIVRDPRDLVVSHYFSKKFSHPIQHNPGLQYIREKLIQLSVPAGLNFIIDCLHNDGTFASLRSWANAPGEDKNLLVLRFEDLTGEQGHRFLKKMFSHLGLHLSSPQLETVLKNHSFEKLSGGRKQGQEQASAHYRKGIQGDWKNYFDSQVMGYLKTVTGDLIELLGYESDSAW